MSDAVARARELLDKATPGPWESRVSPYTPSEILAYAARLAADVESDSWEVES